MILTILTAAVTATAVIIVATVAVIAAWRAPSEGQDYHHHD